MRLTFLLALIAARALVPAGAHAAGAVPESIVGDWDCGAVSLVITRLGSIELISSGEYRAGLFDTRSGGLDVAWDTGGRSRLGLERAGEALRVDGLEAPLTCAARR